MQRSSPIALAGLLAAVLALVSQIALGSLVITDDAAASQRSALAAASVLCTGPGHDPNGGSTRHRPHAPDSALCPLAVALAAPTYLLAPPPPLPDPPRVLASATAAPPPARGPPPETARVGAARAPPPLA